jgi:hypothetical protein
MRIRRRAALLVASVAALGVGFIALPGGAGAQVPNCTPPTTPTNDSCAKLQVAPANPGGTAKSAKLFARTRTNFTSPGNTGAGGRAKTVTLDFDGQFGLNQGTIPTCSTAEVAGKTVAGAWNSCGPGAGTSNNAYLSTQIGATPFGCTATQAGCVSGQARAFPTINACTMVFKGPAVSGNPTVTLFARAPVSQDVCNNPPSTNTGGQTTVVLQGTITTSPVAGFGKRLRVPNVDTAPLPLIDFYAYLKRGNFFQARCPAGASPLKTRALWQYSGGPPSPEPSDTSTSTQACT